MNPVSDIVRQIQDVLKSHPSIQIAVLFGSLAEGRDRPDSDIDLAVCGKAPLSTDQKIRLIDDLAAGMGRGVDLIDLRKAAGLLLQRILVKGVRVLNADRVLYAALIKRMLFNQADMMPYHKRILKKRREAFVHG